MSNVVDNKYRLTADQFTLPPAIDQSPGIMLNGRKVRSILLSTNLDYIHNFETDAVLTIHPFNPSRKVNAAVLEFCDKPVLCGIGGVNKASDLAIHAETAGAAAVVITQPTTPKEIKQLKKSIDCPLMYTLVYEEELVGDLFNAGVDMFNVSTGKRTPETVYTIKEHLPDVPVAANGGAFDSTIKTTIASGADAIVYNPPTATEIMRNIFDQFRSKKSVSI